MHEEPESWPTLPLEEWEDTRATLHLWTQIVGKVRLAHAPMLNHWWQVPLYVTPRGLTTSAVPYGNRTFELEFDFLSHQLRIDTSDGASHRLPLEPRPVSDFYHEVLASLTSVGIETRIWTRPQEVEDAIPFERDDTHRSYDAGAAARMWRILVQSDRVLQRFRSGFLGKSSPVHFFWGSFDLALTRFSGREAPEHPGGVPNLADWVTREAYSHEVSSVGFWPGGAAVPEPAFYAYAYPEPAGYADRAVEPEGAYYSHEMREYILPYELVRRAGSPDEALLAFCESTYDAAADLGGWNRSALERDRRSSR